MSHAVRFTSKEFNQQYVDVKNWPLILECIENPISHLTFIKNNKSIFKSNELKRIYERLKYQSYIKTCNKLLVKRIKILKIKLLNGTRFKYKNIKSYVKCRVKVDHKTKLYWNIEQEAFKINPWFILK